MKRFMDKGPLAFMIWLACAIGFFGGIFAYVDIKKSALDIKRGDTVYFNWTIDNKFYSGSCTNYGTAVDQLGDNVFKVLIFCTPYKGSQEFVSLNIHYFDIIKVDQNVVLTKPSNLDSEE